MTNARGGWHDEFMWGVVVMLFTGIYSFFVKHMWGHIRASDVVEVRDSVRELSGVVQIKSTCEEVQRRMDLQAAMTHEMLNRVLDSVERIEKRMSQANQ